MNIPAVEKFRRFVVGPPKVADDAALALEVCGISKSYHIYSNPRDILSELVTGRPRHREHWAVKDVSFKVRRGEILGLIGPNGAGKSTLLKMIAGTLTPSSGNIVLHGKLSAILELGTGFHPEYTGRENVITGAMCLGMSRAEAEERLPWIIDFSELADVMDQPFRTYSSGMQARLTFATAISIDPEILIIDEALAAGDSYFVVKSFKRIREICRSGATVLFVSHGTTQVAQLCHRAVWLDKGAVVQDGDAREVSTAYDYNMHVRISSNLGKLIDVTSQQLDTENQARMRALSHMSDDDGQKIVSSEEVSLDDVTDSSSIEQLDDALRTDTDHGDSIAADKKTGVISDSKIFRAGPVVIDRVAFVGGDGAPRFAFRTWEEFAIEVDYHCEGAPPDMALAMAVGIEREKDMALAAQFSTVNPSGREDDLRPDEIDLPRASGRFRVEMKSLQILDGDYLVSVGLMPRDIHAQFYEYHHRVYRLRIISAGTSAGALFYPLVEWEHLPADAP